MPSQHPDRARRGHGCAVLGRSIEGLEYWVPAGVYMDHWMLREGVPTPPATHLITLPGATHLSRRPVLTLLDMTVARTAPPDNRERSR